MQEITVPTFPIEKGKIPDVLKENGICVNQYAELFIAHPKFSTEDLPNPIRLVLCSLSELGLVNGAVLEDIVTAAVGRGLSLCRAGTGLFLRLSYTSQPESKDKTLSGAHHSPDGAVVVLSEFLEQDEGFPKGLYLRNVDNRLWLRGYVCDQTYSWSADDIFAFEKN